MRISITGKLNKSARASLFKRREGFTLLELMVVIALIGIVLVVTAPTARNVFTADSLKKASRQLIGLERKLRVEAVRDQIDYILCLDLPTSSYWILTADMTAEKENEVKKSAKKLSAGVRILDIVFPENKKFSEGEVRIRFGKNSICPPMVIHLGDEEEKMTIVVNPFMGVTGIYEEYKDISLEEGMGTERVRL